MKQRKYFYNANRLGRKFIALSVSLLLVSNSLIALAEEVVEEASTDSSAEVVGEEVVVIEPISESESDIEEVNEEIDSAEEVSPEEPVADSQEVGSIIEEEFIEEVEVSEELEESSIVEIIQTELDGEVENMEMVGIVEDIFESEELVVTIVDEIVEVELKIEPISEPDFRVQSLVEKVQKLSLADKPKAVPGDILRTSLSDAKRQKLERTLKKVSRAEVVIDEVAEEIQEPNYLFYALIQTADWWYGGDPTLFHQGIQELHQTYPERGAGITIAVIDTGVNIDHPDLAHAKWSNSSEVLNGIDDDGNGYIDDLNGWDFFININNFNDIYDHGTKVAGLIAGGDNDIGIIGVAPEAKIMPLKVCSDTGFCPADKIISALGYAVEQNVDVIVIALGSPYYSYILHEAITEAVANDIVIVASSGNAGASELYYPSAYPEVIAVGASDQQGQVASFSNTGEGLDFLAPGVNIRSTAGSSDYLVSQGTSLSTGITAGVFALAREHFSQSNTSALIQSARETAQDLGAIGYDLQTGYGMLDPLTWFGSGGTSSLPLPPSPEPSIKPPPGGDNPIFTPQNVVNILPNAQHANDTTGDALNGVTGDDATENPDTVSKMNTGDNIYTADKIKVMQFDTFDTSSIPGGSTINSAVLHFQYGVEDSYNGSNPIRYDNGGGLTTTGITPTDISGWSSDMTFDLHNAGVDTLSELGAVDIEFTNNDGGGGDAVHFDYVWITVDYTAPSGLLTVGTTGTQTSPVYDNTTNNYIGGTFTFVSDGTQTVTQIVLSETGTINANSNLSNADIYYETAGTCTYDGGETLFGTAASFDASENATVSGSMSVGTSQVCVYVVLDVGSGASQDETIGIEITAPQSDITVSSGSVSTSSTVAISGSTTINESSLSLDIVDAVGSSVGSPSVTMGPITFSFTSIQYPTETLGVASEKIRVSNMTNTPSWTVTIGATDGAGALWSGGSYTMDFNDSGGAVLNVDPSSASVSTPGSTNGINTSYSAADFDGSNSITLFSADGTADTFEYFDFTNILLEQTVPIKQKAETYTINLTLTVV